MECDENGFVSQKRSPVWAYFLCCGLVIAAAAMFGFTLDRYPPFNTEDPLFNIPAQRYVDGRSFVYPFFPDAPNAGSILTLHGPFFFRFQVITFNILGVSHFSCRIPSYLAGHIAVLLLCLFLLKRGLYRPAIGLSLLWVGDRTTQELMWGRMDGISLLFLTAGLILFITAVNSRRLFLLAMAGLCAGMAAGFNPSCIIFCAALGLMTLLAYEPRRWVKALTSLVAGAVPPAGLVLLCWGPDIWASFEQFRWSVTTGNLLPFFSAIADTISRTRYMFGWSEPWILVLFFLLPATLFMAVRELVIAWKRRTAVGFSSLCAVCVTLFSFAGTVMYFKSSRHLYYIQYFTVWSVLSFLLWWEVYSLNRSAKIFRACLIAGVVLFVAWLPSLAWNVMRFREAVMYYHKLDKSEFSRALKCYIPAGSPVVGEQMYFIVARNAGLEFSPLSSYKVQPLGKGGDPMIVPSNSMLILSDRYLARLRLWNPQILAFRKLIKRATAFADVPYFQEQYYVYGPERWKQGENTEK